jgi:hypothetical protein
MLHQPLITDSAQVIPAWLTTVLVRAGCIATEQVVAIRIEDQQATGFHLIVRLHVTYSQHTTAPSHFVLKFSQPDRHVRVPENGWEVTFYTRLAAHMPPAANALRVPSDY